MVLPLTYTRAYPLVTSLPVHNQQSPVSLMYFRNLFGRSDTLGKNLSVNLLLNVRILS